jgi:hypothetical protein
LRSGEGQEESNLYQRPPLSDEHQLADVHLHALNGYDKQSN